VREERSLVNQLLEPDPVPGPTVGERRGFGSVPWGVGDMAIVTLVAVVVNSLLAPIGMVGIAGMGGAGIGAFFVQVVISYGLLVGTVWLVGVWRHHSTWEDLGFRPLDLSSLARLLGLLAAIILAADVVVSIFSDLPRPTDIFAFGRGTREVVVMGILVLVAAPFAEEVFFRGFLLQGLARRWRFWPAAVVTSALFALAHIWWQFYLPVFVLGLAFSWLFWRTGSLWASIAAHATINATSFLVALLLGR
jgi:membrane protease YdiL (CAAX protease family)